MLILNRMGVRSRMVALISAAILPFLALIVVGIVVSYAEADRSTRTNVALDAQLGAARFSRVFLDAKVVLGTLRGMPPLQVTDRPRCDSFLQKVLGSQPMFVTMGLLDEDGYIVCHSRSGVEGKFGDNDLARRVLSAGPDDLLVGQFMVGPVSKRPIVAVAMRLPTPSNGQRLSIFASLDVNIFEDLAGSVAGDNDHTVALIEPINQRVLVRWPALKPFGAPFPNHPLIAATAAQPLGGTAFSIGFDGVARFFGFAPVTDATGTSLVLTLGMPESEVFAGVESRSKIGIVISALALVVAMLLSATIAYWTQLKPLVLLASKSELIGNGQFTDPVAIETWQAQEFRGLAESLNHTAEKLAIAQGIEKRTIEAEKRLRLVAENTADMISVVDASGTRTFVSGASRDILGFEPSELINRDPLALVPDEDHELVRQLFRRTRDHGDGGSEQYRVRRRDLTVIWVEVSGKRMPDSGDLVFTMRNISKRKAVEAKLEAVNQELLRLAITDELTNINNRRELNRLLEEKSLLSARSGNSLSLLLLDVDRFKLFNDMYGHAEGDVCLTNIASAIKGSLRRPGDSCARYGGEEFAVILPDTDEQGAWLFAETIRKAVLSLQIRHAANEGGSVSVSIGAVTAHGDCDPLELLRAADKALYAAKQGGRNSVATAPMTSAHGRYIATSRN